MTERFKIPPEAASEINADVDDQASIEAELDELEALVRAAHGAEPHRARPILMSDRWH